MLQKFVQSKWLIEVPGGLPCSLEVHTLYHSS